MNNDAEKFATLPCPFPGSTCYLPVGQAVIGGVVVLHGSEGGGALGHDAIARFLAEHGYVALAFTYCASSELPVAGVPQDVIDIDLENTLLAIAWLQSQACMEGKKTALYGVSRGAEHALILASLQTDSALPRLDCIAVHASTEYVCWGWSLSYTPGTLSTAKAWRWGGQYLPVGAKIRVQDFREPVLLSHGLEDWEFGDSWCADRSKALEKKLRDRSADCVVETHYLPGEGHV